MTLPKITTPTYELNLPSTDEKVKFIVTVSDETLFDNTYKKDDIIHKLFKLTSNKSLTNLHLYNRDGTIRKYNTIYQIMDDHFYARFDMYKERKVYQIDCLEKELQLLSSKLRFINYVIDDKIKRDKMKYELKPEAMTERYKCRKCGSRKCSYYEMQTRSADEPMTQFFTCLDCANRWKM